MGRCMSSPLQGHTPPVSVVQGNNVANLYVDITSRYKIIIDALFPEPLLALVLILLSSMVFGILDGKKKWDPKVTVGFWFCAMVVHVVD